MTKAPQEEKPFETGDLEDDEMFARREREGRVGVGDFVRRAIENTVGSVQGSGSIPRDAITYLLQQGDRGRKEILRIVAKEVGDFLRHVDISTEVIKVLTGVQVDFNASVRFRSTDEGKVKPELTRTSDVTVTTPEGQAAEEHEQEP